MGKKITTVCGDISPQELGVTSMHGHTLRYTKLIRRAILDLTPAEMRSLVAPTFTVEGEMIDDVDYFIDELNAFKKIGGNALCDCSMAGTRVNLPGVREMSKKTGVNIIYASGLFLANGRPDELIGADEKTLIAHFEKEISEGMDGTDVKPGFLKVSLATLGPDAMPEENEVRAFKAAAKVAAGNGMSVFVHITPPVAYDDILDLVDEVIAESGIDPGRILIMHTDYSFTSQHILFEYVTNFDYTKNINTDYAQKMLEKGVNISIDNWGVASTNIYSNLPDDFDRLKGLITLIDRGYEDQIVIGHDEDSPLCRRYTRAFEFAIPVLENFGYDEAIKKITIDNPARILAY